LVVRIDVITYEETQPVYRISIDGVWKGDFINGMNTQTSGIQEALNYAAQIGDAVELGPGTFPVSTTILLPNMPGLVLRGASEYLTTIEQAPGFSGVIMQWAEQTSPNEGYYFGHFQMYGTAGGGSTYLLDLQQNEISAHGILDHIHVLHNNVAAIRLNGNDDTITINLFLETSTNTTGLWWDVAGGSADDIASKFFSGAMIQAQKFNFFGTVIGPYQYLRLYTSGQPAVYNFWGVYWNNEGGVNAQIYIVPSTQTGAVNIFQLNFIGCMINPSGLPLGNPFIYNPTSTTETIYAKFIDTLFQSSSAVNLFGPYINGYAEIDDTNPPLININVNNAAVSTPAVPASGTAQQNANPFPITVYLSGGSATEVQITKYGNTYTIWSSSSAAAIPPLAVRLNPGDSITITYSTAPAWTWTPA